MFYTSYVICFSGCPEGFFNQAVAVNFKKVCVGAGIAQPKMSRLQNFAGSGQTHLLFYSPSILIIETNEPVFGSVGTFGR
jgi:hypothetical protein